MQNAGRCTLVELTLKTATLNDLLMLGEIRAQAIMAQPETFWTNAEKQKAVSAWQEMDVQQNFSAYKIFITENNSAFIGWKENYLGYLFLLPSNQGNGIGSKLLQMAETYISQSHNHIWLFAHPYSEKFYEKHGYIKCAETENPFGTTILHKFEKYLKSTTSGGLDPTEQAH